MVVYANTSAAVKARADWMVTSSCALAIVRHLQEQGEKILWAPDRHLGRYIQQQTGADMLLWNGACIVHDEFKALELELLKARAPGRAGAGAPGVAGERGRAGRRGGLDLAAAQGRGRRRSAPTYIVATDNGILHRMRQLAPGKTLIEAPTAGKSATCKSCAHCPWMAMNALQGVIACLEHGQRRDPRGRAGAQRRRWAASSACSTSSPTQSGEHRAAAAGFVPNIGAA